MVTLLNYSDNNFRWARHFSTIVSRSLGGFDKCISWGPSIISPEFRQKHRGTLTSPRGAGYWLWKPYILKLALNMSETDDWIFYLDSGAFFISSVKPLVKKAEALGQSVIGFELPLIEEQWTKLELKDRMEVDDSLFESNQIMATMFLIRNDRAGNSFAEQYLHFCEQTDLIDDRSWIKQSSLFIEHRHDQSVFSLLYKSNRYMPFEDISHRSRYSKTYCGCECSEIVKRGELYRLNNGRLFRKSVDLPSMSRTLVFLHKTNSPLSQCAKHFLKVSLGRLKQAEL